MNKLFYIIFFSIFFSVLTYLNINSAHAEIYFITKPEIIVPNSSSKHCTLLGYKYTIFECEKQGLKLINPCSIDARYGKYCSCDETKFQFDKSNCSLPRTLGGEVCNEKYEKCDCDSNIYKYYTNADCPKDTSLDTKSSCTYVNKTVGYAKCLCPSEYTEICTGNLEGVGASCNGKYTSCRCNSSFKKCNHGKASGADSCIDSEGTKYDNCDTALCEEGGYYSTVPEGKSCSLIIYATKNCYNNCKDAYCPKGTIDYKTFWCNEELKKFWPITN